MATNEQAKNSASDLISQILGLLDHLLIGQPNLASNIGSYVAYYMPEDHLDSFLDYLKSEKGQVNLQALRDSADKFLDDWP